MVFTKPPHALRRPREIFDSITDTAALPVEDRSEAVLANDDVAVAHVAVHDGLLDGLCRRIALKPPGAERKRWRWCEQLLKAFVNLTDGVCDRSETGVRKE